jgi:site-specific recombinase XerD
MVGSWSTISMYLEEVGIRTPHALKREHCLGYIAWRRGAGHMNKKGGKGKPVSHNTALLELRVLSVIMTEAVHRGIVAHSPTWRLGIKKNPPKEKQELTEYHVQVIREEILRVKESDPELGHYFDTSFEIAMAQGWRLHETHLDLQQVNLESMTVYRVQKGGRTIASPLNPSLVPLFERLRAERRTHTYQQPKLPSLEWFKLFDRLRERDRSFERVSFHSTRVTVVSRLLNAGVGQPAVMKMVGHASATINRLYHRLPASEAAQIFRVLDGSSKERKPTGSPDSPGGTPPTG